MTGRQRGLGQNSSQFNGLQAHQARLGQPSNGQNRLGCLQAHQAQIGQPSSGLNMLSSLSESAFPKLLDFLSLDDDNVPPNIGKNFISVNLGQDWIIDSGASGHMIGRTDFLVETQVLAKKPKIHTPNGGAFDACKSG
ncbi:hypothetical protein CRG98_015995 [Punica granatum]|uniref:Uncharacterized protein n=1 Tax=Punica granatum TaxID=22663 RepID=A0A2I0K4Z9_PUNGR|nr:hypothetical protein CRG98_015995 [Punica granatum]